MNQSLRFSAMLSSPGVASGLVPRAMCVVQNAVMIARPGLQIDNISALPPWMVGRVSADERSLAARLRRGAWMEKTPKLAKLTRPSAVRLLPRQRLVQQLLPRPDAKAVAYIHAPAGSGKTSLAATFAEQLQAPCLWYQVDAGDSDLASVFYHLRIAATAAFSGEAGRLPPITIQ